MFAAGKTAVVASAANYIEDVFSTYLYTGNGSTQTITNGIDLSGKGGLVWLKSRSAATYNALFDTVRGANNVLWSNTTNAQVNYGSPGALTSFGATGFGLNAEPDVNDSGATYASWTFRKQPKFFDVQTFTSNASYGATFSHNLGSAPGCIFIKCTGSSEYWIVWHRSLGNDYQMQLNTTNAQASVPGWITTSSTSITITNDYLSYANTSYVAYIFAHDAGGFGLTGTDNVISCGSFTTSAGGISTVSLGYEPQWVLIKQTNGADSWYLNDNMRGMAITGSNQNLSPNNADAEAENGYNIYPNSTGFTANGLGVSATYIYIAIRRGPMKVPTSGTSVFSPNYYSSTTSTPKTVTTNFPVDLTLNTTTGVYPNYAVDRLRGGTTTSARYLQTQATTAETSGSGFGIGFDNNTAVVDNGFSSGNAGTVYWNFRRAPSFFDEVCTNATSTGQTLITHNLGVTPELIIKKKRSGVQNWATWSNGIPFGNIFDGPNTNGASYTNAGLGNTTPPSVTQFQAYQDSGATYVYYLFATCAGVSKVGSYTGTGATQTISCGFTGGARFVLIKRTDDVGDWYVWDTARGMVSGTDPSLLLNSTAAEVNANSIYTATGGFQIVSTAVGINASGGTYIFLAIA